MDLLNRLLDSVDENLEIYAKPTIMPLSAGVDSISVLYYSSKPETLYMDDLLYNKVILKVMAKNSESTLAFSAVDKIINHIAGLKKGEIKSENGSFTYIKSEIEQNPCFSSMNTGQKFIYEGKVAVFIDQLL